MICESELPGWLQRNASTSAGLGFQGRLHLLCSRQIKSILFSDYHLFSVCTLKERSQEFNSVQADFTESVKFSGWQNMEQDIVYLARRKICPRPLLRSKLPSLAFALCKEVLYVCDLMHLVACRRLMKVSLRPVGNRWTPLALPVGT